MADSYNELFGLGSHSKDANLQAWFPLQDDAANTTVDDLSSNNDDGVLQGGDNTEDKTATGPNSYLTKCLDFNNIDDFIDGIAAPFSGTTAYTVGARFWTGNTSTVNNPLFTWGSTPTAQQMWFAPENGVMYGRFGGNSVYAGSGYNDNVWHSATMSKPSGGTVSGVSIRVDKTGLSETTSGSSTLSVSSANGLVIASRQFTGGELYSRRMCDVIIFDRQLTAAECDEWEDGPEPINTVAPAMTGTETQGDTLSCTTGTWALDSPFASGSNGSVTYAYQWTRSNDAGGTGESDIGGATSSTYVLQAADVGKFIRCRVAASNDGGNDSSADTNSNMSGAIASSSGASALPAITAAYDRIHQPCL